MKEVKMLDWMPSRGIEVANEIQRRGFARGVDFDWAYHKPEYDETSFDLVYNRYCIFRFYKDELATWFELVYR